MLEIDRIPSVIVRMDDGAIRKITAEEDIRAFIKNFSFYDKKKGDESVKEGNPDKENAPIETDVLGILTEEETSQNDPGPKAD